MGGCRCSSGKAPRARPVACAGNGVGCVGGEARAGAVVGGAAVVEDERPQVILYWFLFGRSSGSATSRTVEIGARHCIVFVCGIDFAILCMAAVGYVGLTEVLATGVAARTWVGLDISG